MIISSDHTIADIQGKFNKKFSGLKLEFYAIKHADQKLSQSTDQYSSDLPLMEIGMKKLSHEINFDPGKTVSEMEKEFEREIGLHAQIFRRSNAIWLQTSATDHWTLEVQNRKGMNSIQNNNA